MRFYVDHGKSFIGSIDTSTLSIPRSVLDENHVYNNCYSMIAYKLIYTSVFFHVPMTDIRLQDHTPRYVGSLHELK